MIKLVELSEDDPACATLAVNLMQFNQAQARPYDFLPLRLAHFDARGQLRGGLLGATGWSWLHIDVLFVDPELRQQGIGSALVQRACADAKRRGCIGAMLDTFDFQARGFYQKLGFEVFGTLENMPPGHQRFWMRSNFFESTVAR